VIYRGEILYGPDGKPVKGQWEPILTGEEYAAVTAKWKPTSRIPSRLGAIGRGMGTYYLLSPFLRCGKCNSRMLGGRRNAKNGPVEFYRCPAKGQGGCGSLSRLAAPVNEYIKALMIAEQQKIEFRKLEDLPPWPKAQWPCVKTLSGIVAVSWHMMVLRGSPRTAGCRTGSRSAY
jgi:hypothetical protein